MSDLNFQNFSTVQSALQPQPNTLTAAATVAPTTLITFITGTTAVATITPPVTGQHILCLVATLTNWAGCVTTGNILVASITNGTTWANKLNFFAYNPTTGKYHPCYGLQA